MKAVNKHSFLCIFWVVGILASCNQTKRGWKTIELGRYLLDVPQSFNYKFEQGIDSQGGTITDGKMLLYTNYGFYTDTLVQTPAEYLKKPNYFLDGAEIQFMKDNVTYDSRNFPKITVLSIKATTLMDSCEIALSGSDYVATCEHEGKTFTWPFTLPTEIKQHTVKIDTFSHLYRRIATPKKGIKGMTGVYMRDKRSFSDDINNHYGIVIGKDSLSLKQQQLALQIFATLRPKK